MDTMGAFKREQIENLDALCQELGTIESALTMLRYSLEGDLMQRNVVINAIEAIRSHVERMNIDMIVTLCNLLKAEGTEGGDHDETRTGHT